MESKRRQYWIPVVTGLIQRADEVLLGLRPKGHNLAGFWEFPGGKMEPKETPQVALQRELFEELGIQADIGPVCLTATHDYGDTGILLLFFKVSYWQGEPKTVHHTELKWTKIDDLHKETLPEANKKSLPEILQVLRTP